MPIRQFNQKYVNGDVAATLSAAGTAQSDATAVTAAHCYVTTVAQNAGVKLVAREQGFEFSVANAQSTNTLLLYPWSSSAFNGASADDLPIAIPPNGAAWCKVVNSTEIIAVVGPGS